LKTQHPLIILTKVCYDNFINVLDEDILLYYSFFPSFVKLLSLRSTNLWKDRHKVGFSSKIFQLSFLFWCLIFFPFGLLHLHIHKNSGYLVFTLKKHTLVKFNLNTFTECFWVFENSMIMKQIYNYRDSF
jgi:hypothetical protein